MMSVIERFHCNSTFTFASEDFGFGKYSLIYTMSFFINLTVEIIIVAFPFNIQFITFFLYHFCNSQLLKLLAILFLEKVPAVPSPLRSSITCVHDTVFLTLLIAKTFSNQFGTYPFPKRLS